MLPFFVAASVLHAFASIPGGYAAQAKVPMLGFRNIFPSLPGGETNTAAPTTPKADEKAYNAALKSHGDSSKFAKANGPSGACHLPFPHGRKQVFKVLP
jgi:hypothetical protein